ncbi:CotY/CotZ family spore coat protein [Litchfieldia salsa]|uniref:Spore coat protein Y n=1 Tax=Litchfieldia salsa TaxID=930152 RepID=A0A1H0S3G0_9BACI|nr:CotY/CotZ family spore coat protein [Litchfieldia salsa]SDP36197.1 spore coat protein Y [Litchfieldia salsa]
MGCGKGHKNGCVCDAVQQILDAQEAVEDRCPTSCFENLLSPVNFVGDTIPFVLTGKKGDLFKAFGNVGGFADDNLCFETIFFRVEKLRGCCATLSLLRTYDAAGETINVCSPCDDELFGLERTDFCIEVDLDCFCAIQCLSPSLVDRALDVKSHKHRY